MTDSPVHPESTGSWRYVILLSRFTSAGLQQGMVKSFGLLIPSLVIRLDSSYQIVGFIVSMEYAIFLMTCPFVHLLSRRFNPRCTATVGAILGSMCVMLTSFVRSVWIVGALLMAAGAMTSPVYQTTQVLLHDYFSSSYAAANAIGSTGTQAGGMVLPLVTSFLLTAYEVDGTLLCMGAIFLHFVVIATTLRPRACTNDVSGYNKAATTASGLDMRSSEEGDSNTIDRIRHTTDRDDTKSRLRLLRRYISHVVAWLSDVTDFQAVKAEFGCCVFILPSVFLHQMAFIGWALFMVPYAESVGLPTSRAAYIPLTGAIGGLLGRLVCGGILYLRPNLGKQTLLSGITISSLGLLCYPLLHASWFQFICTLLTGFGLFATFSSFYAVVDNSVARVNFSGVIAFVAFSRGIGVATSGYLTGLIYEMTGSFAVAFRFLGFIDATIIILIVCFTIVEKRWNSREQ